MEDPLATNKKIVSPFISTNKTLDFLEKNFATLRPKWTDHNSSDVGITVVELLAYVGDHLSYYQDAVATEDSYDAIGSVVY